MLEAKVKVVMEEYVKLTRGQKGSYGWEIKVFNFRLEPEDIYRLKRLDERLQASFIGNDKPEEVKGE